MRDPASSALAARRFTRTERFVIRTAKRLSATGSGHASALNPKFHFKDDRAWDTANYRDYHHWIGRGGVTKQGIAPRCVDRNGCYGHEDLAFLKESFGNQLVRVKADAANRGRVAYAWSGPMPHILAQPLAWISDGELLALVAARGLLHVDDQSIQATRGTSRTMAGLSDEVHRLIQRTGMADPAKGLGRHIVTVSRFGAAPISGQVLTACLGATISGQAITFTYTNLEGDTSSRHALPLRMVLIRGEWYCIAWARILRTFRLARMAEVQIAKKMPENTPTHIPSQAVDDLLKRPLRLPARAIIGLCHDLGELRYRDHGAESWFKTGGIGCNRL